MLTLDIKINEVMIRKITVVKLKIGDPSLYSVSVYDFESVAVNKFEIWHREELGMEMLVSNIMRTLWEKKKK